MFEPGHVSGGGKERHACFMYNWTWSLMKVGNERGEAVSGTVPPR